MSFENLKKNSKNSIDKLNKELEKLSGNNNNDNNDDRFWYCQQDKSGNGFAIIRFLPPAPDGEDAVPFIKTFKYAFQGPGGWYIENSLNTIGQADPCAEHVGKLYSSGKEEDKEIAKPRNRKTQFISNILVIKDPANPENEGKVFLYRYGKQIFDKLKEKISPSNEYEDKMDPFNMWAGANFKLKIKKVEGYPNYSSSEFETPSVLSDDDDELEKIYNQTHSLQEILDPSNYKSYDELKSRLDRVLGEAKENSPKKRKFVEEEEDEIIPAKSEKTTEAKKIASVEEDDDDDDLAFFRKLSEED